MPAIRSTRGVAAAWLAAVGTALAPAARAEGTAGAPSTAPVEAPAAAAPAGPEKAAAAGAPARDGADATRAVLASLSAGWTQLVVREGTWVIEAACIGPKGLSLLDAAGPTPRLRVNFGLEAIDLPIRRATRVDANAAQIEVEYLGTRSLRVELVEADRGVVAMWSEPGPVPPKAPNLFRRPERYVSDESRTLYRQMEYGCPVGQ